MPPKPAALPIDAHVPAIREALAKTGCLVLVAEPGAGKTTRVPPALLDLAGPREILVLEPRRLAARMAARRVAEELGETVRERVGYRVRFEDATGPQTRLVFVTEGILSRRLAADPTLRGVGAVVFDEFHERSLHTDLGLALVQGLRRGPRPDLRVVVMSATIDPSPVAAFLGCTALSVEGRTFPVTVEHAEGKDDRPLHVRTASAVHRLAKGGLEGDVLVFLPGAGEIRRARDALQGLEGADLVTLHGDLPPGEQDRAVAPGPRPKVILSTNVAETSITVEGVTAVVDSGLARVARHSPWTGLPELRTVGISQASATQRAGRAGRTRPGRCVRLYTKHEHDTRPPHDEPEIRRADLTEMVLLLRSTGHDPRTFPFFERPKEAAVRAADDLLARLSATAADAQVTDVGRRLLALPTHPRLGRLLLEAEARGVGARGCLLAALLSEREIRRELRTRFETSEAPRDEMGSSDLLERLETFEAVEALGLAPHRVRAHGLDVAAVRAVDRARDQLVRALGTHLRPAGPFEEEEESLLIATLAAFPDRVGRRRQKDAPEVVFSRGGQGRLLDTSVVKDAPFLAALDVDERRRGSARIRTASRVEPEWLLELFPSRIEERSETRFDRRTERVEAVRALLYDGLVLDESRAADPSGPECSQVLAKAALEAGLGQFLDEEALEALLARLEFASAHGLDRSPPDPEALAALLARACQDLASFAALREAGLLHMIRAELGHDTLSALDLIAPETVAIAGRPRVPVRYEPGRPPFIASRLQDFFGMADGPRVARGAVSVVLHLLAPNRRAVQVTTDLAGFWDRHYPALRRQLMRRYPRHAWPEDPRTRPSPKPGRRRG